MRLGQHMLINRRIAERIASYAELDENDVVLEVGCGTGNLTQELLRFCRVVGIEKDEKFVETLRKRFRREIEDERFSLIHGDALKLDFPFFTKFVSNIPYEISSPLIFKLVKHNFTLAVVMLQKEFAERLCNEDSRLGVISKAYCRAKILEIVGRENFRPIPKVDSAITMIIPQPQIEVKDRERFEKFVTFAFSMRRKKLSTIVRAFEKRFGISLELDDELANKRPEKIGARNFARIVDGIRAS
ncbi:MAG: 16S rRNA (adenine(1518)-N(6)/adenine(1519)-N(6))-dimethyltransferase RsmA [Archaeoglobaceae archaeon]